VIDFWQRKGQKMARKRLQPEEIILKLREVEIDLPHLVVPA
jgi:hypothetical protein